MSYDVPTSDDLIELFPEFAGQDDAAASAITQATAFVDTSWIESDYALAIMLLAAHYLAVSNATSAGGTISSVSLGPISVSFLQASTDGTLLSTTPYGRRFQELRMKSFPAGVMVL